MQTSSPSSANDRFAMPQEPCVPEWALKELLDEQKKIGFEVLSVPSTRIAPPPRFIPFPEATKFTVCGKPHANKQSVCPESIQLEAWEDVRKGLYDPHVEIEYAPLPKSCWYIRSLHGFRRGTHGVVVRGKTIQAATGAVPLANGDEVCLGMFKFRFRTERFEEILRYEDPYQLVKEIELDLKQIADADEIGITDLVQAKDMQGCPIKSWKQVSWSQFENIVTNLWDKPSFQKIREGIESIQELCCLIKKAKNARNIVGHPIRGDLRPVEKKHVVQLYQLLRSYDSL